MKSEIAAFVLAMVVTALLTPLVRRLALALGAVDEPGGRRVHTRRVPRMGGIAITLGFFLPLLLLFALRTQASVIFFSNSRLTIALIVGSVLTAGVGLLDDLKGLGAKTKLVVQTLAGVAAYAGGMRIQSIQIPGIVSVGLGIFSLPATILWIVGIVNAINLIDGLDGLAAGVAFFACLTNFAIASLTGNLYIALVTASLAGSVIGFLFHNFNPAKIFMGDSGSMFLGFILASASLLGAGSQKSPTLIAIVVPVLALGLPITDMLLTIARRFLERRSIFSADRGHIHHRLIDMGLTHRHAVYALYLVSIVFTVAALITYVGRSWQVGTALFVLTVLLVVVVRFVGYFNPMASRIGDEMAVALRRAVPPTLLRLADTSTLEHLPSILAAFGADSGLLAISIVNPKAAPLQRWGWESPRAEHGVHEAVCAKFPVSDGDDGLELQFFVDSPAGTIGPQVRILLQLVADGAEARLAASTSMNRDAPWPRFSRSAQGGE